MELSKIVEQILKITNESPYGRLDMDSMEAGEIWKLLNKGEKLPIDFVSGSNCCKQCKEPIEKGFRFCSGECKQYYYR
jgi:hypothetical protein